MKTGILAFGALCAAVGSALGQAQTVTLESVADATMYSPSRGSENTNGAGQFLFCGRTGGGDTRRALLRFDVGGSIPAGSVVNDVTLELWMTRTSSGPQAVSVHRASSPWSEGPTAPGGSEGGGGGAVAGDVSWSFATLPGTPWTTAGGDFAAAASASKSVDQTGSYSWSGAGLVGDVQAWADGASNFGWLLLGSEAEFPTSKRFGSRENEDAGVRPVLTVVFTPAPMCAGDWDQDGDTDSDDVVLFFGAWDMGEGDVDGDEDSDSDDIVAFFTSWDSGC